MKEERKGTIYFRGADELKTYDKLKAEEELTLPDKPFINTVPVHRHLTPQKDNREEDRKNLITPQSII